MNFLWKYFWGPVIADALNHPINGIHEGYNIFNTITYAILALIAIYLTYLLIKKLKIKIDKYFVYSLLIFSLVGATWRVMEDLMLIPMPWTVLFITPLIYIVLYTIAIIPLIIFKDSKIMGYIGIGILIPSLFIVLFRQIAHPMILLLIPLIAALVSLPLYLFKSFKKIENIFFLFGHMVDAFATYFSVTFFNYGEKHVLTSQILKFSPISYIFIKYLIVLTIIYILKDYKDEPRIYIISILAMLGLATGFRDTLRLAIGV